MLPPGHLAVGFLTAKLVTSSLHYDLTAYEKNVLVFLGTLIAFIPDLDFFLAFFKTKSFRIENDKVVHRKFVSHAPLAWAFVGIMIFLLSPFQFWKAFGLLVWLCSWSHFIFDSEWGIMWLWPFSSKFYPFSKAFYAKKYLEKNRESSSFIKYWFYAVKNYYSKLSGVFEIIIILIALIVIVK
jgi:hypothetical protein